MKHIFIITFILFVLSIFISIIVINNKITPILIEIAQYRTEQHANRAMGIAVNKKLVEDLDTEDLIEIDYDEEGNVVSYGFNPVVQNRVQRNIQYRVENFLAELEKGNIPDQGAPLDVELDQEEQPSSEAVREKSNLIEIPIGQVLGIPLLANFGPRIPVNIETTGFVSTEVKSSVLDLGINNTYIEMYVLIEVELRVLIPFESAPVHLEQRIPIGNRGINGEVPYYYNDGGGNAGDISLPIDPSF
ncbi:sporulation protein YunB [Radiobacillus sp. PE A8.2]|uniref:sporulation protein YunB n=1 Tax=Radiobacillus sp. PE A8.2 TaxID=3380349 RepID=UPI00388E5867